MSMVMSMPNAGLSKTAREEIDGTTVAFLYTSLDTSLRKEQLGLSGQCRVRLVLSDDDFFDSYTYDSSACILIDVSLPKERVARFIRSLRKRWISVPMLALFNSNHVESACFAASLGCSDCIRIPCRAERLLEAIAQAMRLDRMGEQAPRTIRHRLACLGAQERRVLDLTLRGMTSKEIAAKMEVRYQTVDKYRRSVYRKLRVANIVELQSMLYESLYHAASARI
jgi:FixJ family two-component response regulator